MTLSEVQQRGLRALQRELGTVGMIRFVQQFTSGKGDYTAEREHWLSRLSVERAPALVGENAAFEQPGETGAQPGKPELPVSRSLKGRARSCPS